LRRSIAQAMLTDGLRPKQLRGVRADVKQGLCPGPPYLQNRRTHPTPSCHGVNVPRAIPLWLSCYDTGPCELPVSRLEYPRAHLPGGCRREAFDGRLITKSQPGNSRNLLLRAVSRKKLFRRLPGRWNCGQARLITWLGKRVVGCRAGVAVACGMVLPTGCAEVPTRVAPKCSSDPSGRARLVNKLGTARADQGQSRCALRRARRRVEGLRSGFEPFYKPTHGGPSARCLPGSAWPHAQENVIKTAFCNSLSANHLRRRLARGKALCKTASRWPRVGLAPGRSGPERQAIEGNVE